MPQHRKTHVETMPERLPDPWAERQPLLPLPGINRRVIHEPVSSSAPMPSPPRPRPRPLAKAQPRQQRLAMVHELPTRPPPATTIHTQETVKPPPATTEELLRLF